MKHNSKIGTLGEAFIQKWTALGIDFDEAWDAWQRIQDKLMFIIVGCPEVQYYDNRRITDVDERARLRQVAQAELGDYIRSVHVSRLARVANWLQVEIPIRPYRMDRNIIVQWILAHSESFEIQRGDFELALDAKEMAESEEEVENIAQEIEQFAVAHSLWAVPPEQVIKLWVRHQSSLCTTDDLCEVCGKNITVEVDPHDGRYQHLTSVCPACGHTHDIRLFIRDDGEVEVRN